MDKLELVHSREGYSSSYILLVQELFFRSLLCLSCRVVAVRKLYLGSFLLIWFVIGSFWGHHHTKRSADNKFWQNGCINSVRSIKHITLTPGKKSLDVIYSFPPPALRCGRYAYSSMYLIAFPAYSATGCLFYLILILIEVKPEFNQV